MQKEVSSYYDYTLPFYRFFWYKNRESMLIHYGLWKKGTKSFEEALMNTNRFLAKIANIKKEDIVLDAGCGVGGSSIWLAENLAAEVTGISISNKQIDEARKLAKKNSLIKFFVMDVLRTKFPDSFFDVVWAIESACHAENKKDFLKEAYRLLRRTGRLVIADGFLRRAPKLDDAKDFLSQFCNGFAVPNLALAKDFEKMMREVGFKNIKVLDKTGEFMPSSQRILKIARFAYPISILTEKLHLTSPILTKHILAGIAQYKVFGGNLGGYFVFYGEK